MFTILYEDFNNWARNIIFKKNELFTMSDRCGGKEWKGGESVWNELINGLFVVALSRDASYCVVFVLH